MKKIHFILATLVLFFACQDEEFLTEVSNGATDLNNVGSKASAEHLALYTSPVFDWENMTRIRLYGSNEEPILPWANAAGSMIPYFITASYTKADGWELVYNTCTPDSPAGEVGKYYLMFYNIFTGIMRVYYYNTYGASSGTTTFWSLAITQATRLLNANGYFTIPGNTNGENQVFISNITTVPAKGVTAGWNCFDVEFAYDTNFTANRPRTFISVGGYDFTTSNIRLDGDIQLNSEGTILNIGTHTSKKSYDDVGKAAGNAAKGFLNDKLNTNSGGFFPNLAASVIPTIVGGGVTELVNFGINKLFGSFIGRKSADPVISNYSIDMKTNGKVTINGDISTITSSKVKGISNLLLPGTTSTSVDYFIPSYNEPLGVWNLKQRPIIYYGHDALYERLPREEFYMYERKYLYEATDIYLNESLRNKIDRYEVTSEALYYEKFNDNYEWSVDYRNVVASGSGRYVIYPYNRVKLYDDNRNTIYRGFSINLASQLTDFSQLPSTVRNVSVSPLDLERWYNEHEGDIPSQFLNFVIKVTVTLYPKQPYNQDPIVMTRSYIPEYRPMKWFTYW